MVEFVLVVWLVLSGPDGVALAPAFEVGVYYKQARCEAAVASVVFSDSDVEFIALCIERDK